MDILFLCVVIFLFLLAVFDLSVGVSNCMMDIARHGIFRPEHFAFYDLIRFVFFNKTTLLN